MPKYKSITLDDKTYDTTIAACRAYGIPRHVYEDRQSAGWSIKKILTTPAIPRTKPIKINGEIYATTTAVCKAYDVNIATFCNRRRLGWSVKEALGIKERKNISSDRCTGRVYIIYYQHQKQ